MYHKREWLNKEGVYATSTITVFHGTSTYLADDNKRIEFDEKKLCIHDCQNSIRLHQMTDETDREYINKIRKVSNICAEFASYLESQLESRSAKGI